MELLENYAVPFKVSKQYKTYKNDKTAAKSENTIGKLHEFAEKRDIETSTK